jgi:pyrroline-5-carboxylate reductase
MKLGFIGTGNITTVLVEGLCTAQDPPASILVSPRNAEKAARLALKFSQVEIASSNQAVVDGCNCVFLAVLPPVASSVLGEIRFRSDQTVICLIATKPIAEVRQLVKPAQKVVRAVPMPPAAKHLGPIAIYPQDPQVVEVLAKVGMPVVVQDERQFNILWTLTALIAPFYTLIEEVCRWSTYAGVDRQISGPYLASMFHALSTLAAGISDGDFSGLLADASTPGGLNEQALAEIRKQGGYETFLNALDSIAVRLGEKVSKRR